MREQRHDDGSGFVIRSEKDDIWDRMTRVETCKLDDKLQEAIQYGNYHKKIGELTSLYDCKDMEFELMENDNVYLNRVIRKLWSELAAKQEELVSAESEAVTDFRRKTDKKFHQIDGMGAAEIESIVFDYIQSKIIYSFNLAGKVELIKSNFPVISRLYQCNICDILCLNRFFFYTIFSIHTFLSPFHKRLTKTAIVVASQVSKQCPRTYTGAFCLLEAHPQSP